MKVTRVVTFLICVLQVGSNVSAGAVDLSANATCCSDGLGLNYTLPMFDECKLKQHQDGSMIQTIPKLIPASSAEATQCRRQSKLGIPPGHRICAFPDCLSNPCVNGWCQESMSGYQCHCLAGYSGRRCRKNKPDSPTTMSSGPPTRHANYTSSTTRALSQLSATWRAPNTTEPPGGKNETYPAACTELSTSFCPDGWLPGEDKCYRFPDLRAHNWTQSVDYCDNLPPVHIGQAVRYPSLLVPESVKEVDVLRRCVIPHDYRTCYWINCKRVSEHDEDQQFSCKTTRQGNTTSYRNWKSGQPNNVGNNQDCVTVKLSDRMAWSDTPCSRVTYYCYFACQIRIV